MVSHGCLGGCLGMMTQLQKQQQPTMASTVLSKWCRISSTHSMGVRVYVCHVKQGLPNAF